MEGRECVFTSSEVHMEFEFNTDLIKKFADDSGHTAAEF